MRLSNLAFQMMLIVLGLHLLDILAIYNLGRDGGSYTDSNLISHWRLDDATARDDKKILSCIHAILLQFL